MEQRLIPGDEETSVKIQWRAFDSCANYSSRSHSRSRSISRSITNNHATTATMKSTTALVLSALLAVVVIVALVSAQPPRPSVDHQTSYGIISSVNEWGALEERTAITAIDPKLKLYRSDQSTMRDAQGLYAVCWHSR